MDLVNRPEFMEQAPASINAILQERMPYVCSTRTIYRLLAKHRQVRERRNQLRHPVYTRPELLATGPCQLWSWDITKLRGPIPWTYYYLYVVLDVFSRYVVGWLIADTETSALAQQVLGESYHKQNVTPGQLTVHADRGTSMRAKATVQFLADLGVTRSYSRPQVSNDNPFSEAQFKTLKYRPNFSNRFGSREDARSFCQAFFSWYNQYHRHSALAYCTPAMVHDGMAEQMLELRQRTLDAAFEANPHRFKYRRPLVPALPREVWINPPPSTQEGLH